MLPITALDLDSWAARQSSRSELPVMMRRLVHARATSLKHIEFPAYEATNEGGWDGEVISEGDDPWIPSGESFWELTCEGRNTLSRKATRDFNKRTDGTPEVVRAKSTFVFVTPRKWSGKAKWRASRLKDGTWADVRVYDAETLSQWIEQAPAAAIWMQERLGRSTDDLTSIEDVWTQWANVTKPVLTFVVFEQALEESRTRFENFFSGQPDQPFEIAADTRAEAAAFATGALLYGNLAEADRYRSVVARTRAGLQYLKSLGLPLTVLVQDPELEAALGGLPPIMRVVIATDKSGLDRNTGTVIDPLTWDAFRKAAEALGLSEEDRSRLDHESGRRISVLRRRMATIQSIRTPRWAADNSSLRMLVALALAGGWDWRQSEDRHVLAALTALPEADIEVAIRTLAGMEDAPIYIIGDVGGIVSRPDAMTALRNRITSADLQSFFLEAKRILTEADPALELPEDQRWFAAIHGKHRKYSTRLRRNADSIAYLATAGQKLVTGFDGATAAFRLVSGILATPDEAMWLHVRDILPSLAEAAPDAFLTAIEHDLPKEASDVGVWRLIKPVRTVGPGDENYRTGLLWALERLAWSPELFPRVVAILAALSERLLDDNWVNKPINSLKTCFHPWLAQTAAPIELRVRALRAMEKRHTDVAWTLSLAIIDQRLGYANYAARPRYRQDAVGHGYSPTSPKHVLFETAVDLLLSREDVRPTQILQLIETSTCFEGKVLERLWDRVEGWAINASVGDLAAAREHIRRTALRGMRKNADQTPDARAAAMFERLKPQDSIYLHAWLFKSSWVEFGSDELDGDAHNFEERERRIAKARTDALTAIWNEGGFVALIDFAKQVDAPWVVGTVAFNIIPNFDVSAIAELLRDNMLDAWAERASFVSGVLSQLNVSDRVCLLTDKVDTWSNDKISLIDLLHAAPADLETWAVLDKLPEDEKTKYWKGFRSFIYGQDGTALERACTELLSVGRPVAAFQRGRLHANCLDSRLILDILKNVAFINDPDAEHLSLQGHQIESFLDVLDNRSDYDTSDLIQVEFIYCRHLEHTKRGIRAISKAIASDPEIFVQAVAAVYRRDDWAERPSNPETDEAVKQSWLLWHSILQNCRFAPGADDNGVIDPKKLDVWLRKANDLLVDQCRSGSGQHMIGEILGRTRIEIDGSWPHLEIASVLEPEATDRFCQGIYIGIVNSRGVHWRDRAGGSQERLLANKFREWRRRIEVECPRLANAFEQVAKSYDYDAEREDKRAALERATPE